MILLSGTVRIRLVVKRRPRRSARRRRWRPRLARPNAPGSHASRPFWVVWVPVPRPGGRYTRVKPRQSASHANVKSKRRALRCARANQALPQAGSGLGGGPKAPLRHTMPHHGMARPRRLSLPRSHRQPTPPGPTSFRIDPPRIDSPGPTSSRADSSQPNPPGRLHLLGLYPGAGVSRRSGSWGFIPGRE